MPLVIDMDPKARRFLLRPLQRRTHGQLDPEFYVKAVRRLDQRALGEITLAQLNRVVYSLRDRHSGSWEDPARAKELVALAKALYATRRISRQEYVFYALCPVEAVHEGRISNGNYKTDLQPIEEAIDKIEREEELGPD